ncbi:MAG TPA: helix-hairpin-helix domain-containing protein [Bacteroidia bacterium]|nr:helix-hairpin-helix domain-containing protein [Bacteroidia bacterium]
MFNRISKYFTLNRRERNGMIAIATLLIVLLVVKYFIIYNYNPTTTNVNVIALDSLATELAPKQKHTKNNSNSDTLITKEIKLYNFDPNTISYKEAIQLGFPKKVAHTLINYRNKGAKFYNAEGLKKVYGMTDELYEKLAPYVSIKK